MVALRGTQRADLVADSVAGPLRPTKTTAAIARLAAGVAQRRQRAAHGGAGVPARPGTAIRVDRADAPSVRTRLRASAGVRCLVAVAADGGAANGGDVVDVVIAVRAIRHAARTS